MDKYVDTPQIHAERKKEVIYCLLLFGCFDVTQIPVYVVIDNDIIIIYIGNRQLYTQ